MYQGSCVHLSGGVDECVIDCVSGDEAMMSGDEALSLSRASSSDSRHMSHFDPSYSNEDGCTSTCMRWEAPLPLSTPHTPVSSGREITQP